MILILYLLYLVQPSCMHAALLGQDSVRYEALRGTVSGKDSFALYTWIASLFRVSVCINVGREREREAPL